MIFFIFNNTYLAIRCHSQNNSSAIDQNCTEDLTNATKYKLQNGDDDDDIDDKK
ncbi:hypothetical protein Smp_171390 [Schistosoma mansoni]|uniref:hypothetical protein n=1 Tax=Schistosoma mansoni TaxID=6183 RepID=UPI0001A6213F|nr:hypothetical protein Smp_171390 [Schistosoma mansoni]|eukprot:XP_018655179.1 hypothetical protein Smp_171390 [Schistosoma mansoni]